MKIKKSFDQENEKLYLYSETHRHLGYIRGIFLLFMIFYGLFYLVDLFHLNENLSVFILIRFGIVIPILLITVIMTFTKYYYKLNQYMVSLSFFAGGAGIAYMLILKPESIVYSGGLFIVIFSGYLLIRLRYIYATSAGSLIILFYMIVYLITHKEFTPILFYNLVFFLCANTIGLVGAYNIEKTNRQQFLNDQEIKSINALLKQQYDEKNEKLILLENSINENKILHNLNIEKDNLAQSLEKSEKRFRTLFEKAPFGYQSLDISGHFLDVNQKWLEIMGYQKEEVIGKWFGDFLVPEMKEQFTKHFEMFKQRGSDHSEFSMKTKNGDIILVGFDGNVSYDENHAFVQTHCTVTDITEISIASNKLKQRNALIEGLFNHMTSGVAIYEVINDGSRGSDYIIKDFNDISLSWENKSRDEVIGKALSELHSNIDDSGLIDFFRKVWKTGESIVFPARQYVNGNYNRWHENRIFKLPSGEIVAMYDDVTERVLIENQRTKEHLDLLTSQKIAKLGTWRLDVKTNEISMSEELYKMHGFDPTKPVPPYSEHMKLFTKESREQLSTALALTSTKGIPYQLELEMVSNNEPNGWMWVRGEAEYDDQGQIVSLTGTAQDNTERKQLEQNLKEAHQIALLGRWELTHNENQLDCSENIFNIFEIDSKRFESSYEGFLKVIHPDDRSAVEEAFKRSLVNKQAYSIEHRLLMEDGRIKWVSEKCNTDFDEKGQPIRSVGVVQDITEQKLLTLEAEKNHQIITSILAQSPVAIEFFDSDGYHTYANDAALELFGVQNSVELKGLNLFDNPNIPIELCDRIKKAEAIHVELEYDFTKVQDKNFYQTEKDGKILLDLFITPLTSNQVISGYIIHSKDITEERQKQNEIEYLGNHDYLTNLFNRRYFVNAFDALASKNCSPLGLMMIDINGLKIINDAYGHVKGDDAIRQVANLLMEVFDKDDVIARIGGDEFVVLAPYKNALHMQALKDKLVLLSQDIKIDNIPVSLAIGYEILSDNDTDIDELLSRAEKQLYRHKITVGESIRNHAIKAILNTLTDKYKEEKIHSAHVSQLCKQIGTELGLSKEEIDVLELAGMYHDIGKISIPDAILNKPGKLTDEEYDIIKTHTQIGYQILRAADEYSGLAEYALSHHERWDGRGYPKGLKGEDIPLFSRIINVADSFEAMTADRPYRKGMPIEDAIAEIKRCSGSQFDPDIANLFLEKVLNYEQ